MKRRNSIAEFSFQLSAVPTHYCPSDSGSIYNTMAPETSVCYLRQPDEEVNNVPEESSNRVTTQPLAKRFPNRSLSDSVLVLKDKNCAAKPTSIIPSWKPQSNDEKPPYSYATLIAYAILSSSEQKLPLNDIYLSISANFPYYVLGDNGWQNSIRHNLSLNKSFIKLDRKPSDARPGKGSYWKIVDGQERAFIDALTRPGGPLRKQTVNVGKRTMSTNSRQNNASCENLLIMGPQDFEKCSKPTHSITTSLTSSEPVSLPDQPSPKAKPTTQDSSSPMITIFRMAPMVNDGYRPRRKSVKSQKRDHTSKPCSRKRRRTSITGKHDDHDSDCDSGVDVGNEFVPNNLLDEYQGSIDFPPFIKQQSTALAGDSSYLLDCLPSSDDLLLESSDLSYLADCDSPTSCTLSSFLDEPASPTDHTSFSIFSQQESTCLEPGYEFEENLLLTQSSSLYSQEEWSTNYLS
ncbi:hypothetical protein INT43_008307, partial [Umbelopsis isabellina]